MSWTRGILLLLLATLSGCTLGRDYVRPEIESPQAWYDGSPAGESVANTPWFELFEDSVLVDLIDAALAENRNLAVAAARIDEAAAALGVVRSDLYPKFSYGGSAAVDGNSSTDWEIDESAAGFLGLSWQIDLWGRIRRSEEAALQTVLAAEEGYRGVTISLVSAVASSYFLLLSLDDRVVIAEETIRIREENYDLVSARFQGGSVSGVDLNQAIVQLAEAEAQLEAFRRLSHQTENALNLLLGREPRPIPRGSGLEAQITRIELPAGLPSELLERRPDIVAAERSLHAQTAQVGVAEALRFPQFDLTGSVAGVLSDPNVASFDLAAEFFGPLFDAGASRGRVEVEEARTRQLLANYEQAILNAWREVDDALAAVRTFAAETRARERQVAAASDAADLAWVRYDGGMTSYLEVLETQRSLFSTQLQASATRQQWLASMVQLYAALGGGWYPAEPTVE